MNLQIECPACQRRFQVDDDLTGKTVECGACDHRFSVTEKTTVQERKKFYPGEHDDGGLDHFGRAPMRECVPVTFQTAEYTQSMNAEEVQPTSPIQIFASIVGIVAMLFFGLFIFLASSEGGIFADVDLLSRFILGGFISMVGCGLLVFGAKGWRGRAIGVAIALILILFFLIWISPVKIIPSTHGGLREPLNEIEKEAAESSELNDVEKYLSKIGYAKVEDFIKKETNEEKGINGLDHVVAIYVHRLSDIAFNTLEEHLRRRLSLAPNIPIHNYKRNDMKDRLIVISGPKLNLEAVARACDEAGDVLPVSKHRLLDLSVNQASFATPKPKEMEKLKNPEHEIFCAANLSELDNIHIDRRKNAVERLAVVPDDMKKRFKSDIAQKLAEIVATESDEDLIKSAGSALQKWGLGEAAIVKAVGEAVIERLEAKQPIPKSVVDYLILVESDQALLVVDLQWARNPTRWLDQYEQLGSKGEDRLAFHIKNSPVELRKGAVDILRKVGTEKSIPTLRSAVTGANDGFDISLKRAIESIQSR